MANKNLFQNQYRIPPARLEGYDYSWPGFYFVTIGTKNRFDYFGKIINNKMEFTEIGRIANECWHEIPLHYPFVRLDEFVVMPDHVHGVLIINDVNAINVETQYVASLPINQKPLRHHNKFAPQSNNLSSIIRGYKIGVKKYAVIHNLDFFWQPRFYDRIIRDERGLINIRQYIKDNPINWEKDRNNPAID